MRLIYSKHLKHSKQWNSNQILYKLSLFCLFWQFIPYWLNMEVPCLFVLTRDGELLGHSWFCGVFFLTLFVHTFHVIYGFMQNYLSVWHSIHRQHLMRLNLDILSRVILLQQRLIYSVPPNIFLLFFLILQMYFAVLYKYYHISRVITGSIIL